MQVLTRQYLNPGGLPIYMLKPWKALQNLGQLAGMFWEIQGGNPFLPLPTVSHVEVSTAYFVYLNPYNMGCFKAKSWNRQDSDRIDRIQTSAQALQHIFDVLRDAMPFSWPMHVNSRHIGEFAPLKTMPILYTNILHPSKHESKQKKEEIYHSFKVYPSIYKCFGDLSRLLEMNVIWKINIEVSKAIMIWLHTVGQVI